MDCHSFNYPHKDFAMREEKGPIEIFVTIRQCDMQLKVILKKLIKGRGISIAHLSRATSVPLQTLHGWLNGVEPRSFRQVKLVADYFEVDLDYLCFGISPKSSPSNKYEDYADEINAGTFEVVLRRIKK